MPSLQIIRERLPNYPERNGLVWNSSPGALLTLPTYSDAMRDYPFLLDLTGHEPKANYTAVIYVQVGNALTPTSALYRLVKAVTKSQFVDRVSVRRSYGPAPPATWLTVSASVSDFNFMGLRKASPATKEVAPDGAPQVARSDK